MVGEESGEIREAMKNPYEFIMGRAPVEECIPMEKVAELKFNSILVSPRPISRISPPHFVVFFHCVCNLS